MWRIEQRIERLNDLGFDVDELDIVTDFDGDRVRHPAQGRRAGHHQRELQGLTGLHVEDAQARRLLNDIAAFTAHHDLGREDRQLVANRWLTEYLRADHRHGARPMHAASWSRRRSSTRSSCTGGTSPSGAGHEVDIFDTARDYIDIRADQEARGGGRRRAGRAAGAARGVLVGGR